MRLKKAALILGLVAACTGLTATTAGAYIPDPTYTTWTQDTGQCWNTCAYEDWANDLDGTFFKRDVGGKALKMHLYSPTRTVAQVEFHPYDEQLWIYDGANDGDTIYVRVEFDEGIFSSERKETHWVPNTEAAIDSKLLQLDSDDDIDEGTEVRLRVYDDKDLTDPITGWYELKA